MSRVPSGRLRQRRTNRPRPEAEFGGVTARLRHRALLAGLRLLPLSLVFALLRLVVGERLGRIDVAERRVPWHEVLRGLDAEPLREHRSERLDLHLAEPR